MKKTELIERLKDIKNAVGDFSASTVKSYIDELIEDL